MRNADTLRLDHALLDRTEAHLAAVRRTLEPIALESDRFQSAKVAALRLETNMRTSIATLRERRSVAHTYLLASSMEALADTLDFLIQELQKAKTLDWMTALIQLQPPVATTPNDVHLAAGQLMEAVDAALDARAE